MARFPLLMIMALTLSLAGAAAEAAPARKGRPPRKSMEEMTLEDYDREEPESDGRATAPREGKAERNAVDAPQKGKKFASHTEIGIGGGLTFGSWSASRSNSTLANAYVQQLLIPAPAYVTVGVNGALSPSTPRNFMLSATLGAGLMHVKSSTAPFVGFRIAATRLVASGRGRAFGMGMGPEVGFFPLHIGKCPVSMRVQYNWLAARVGGSQPRWATLNIGVVF